MKLQLSCVSGLVAAWMVNHPVELNPDFVRVCFIHCQFAPHTMCQQKAGSLKIQRSQGRQVCLRKLLTLTRSACSSYNTLCMGCTR